MSRPAERMDDNPAKADGSEPGGGSGMQNIERLAGDGVRREHEASEERRVEQMAAGVGDMPDVGEASRRDRD